MDPASVSTAREDAREDEAQAPGNAHEARIKLWVAGVRIAIALVGLGLAAILADKAWRPTLKPVAASFTRIGGRTRVETALEAARFFTAPKHVVTVRWDRGARTSSDLVLTAARCAVHENAPLLFKGTALSEVQRRRVAAEIKQMREGARPGVGFEIPQSRVMLCINKAKPFDAELSLFDVRRNPLKGIAEVGTERKLSSFIVLAAPRSEEAQPDVAIGLALAAHIAATDRMQVSLVVVPRDPQVDREALAQLRGQNELVEDGVVLGQTRILSDDSRTVLRQIIAQQERPSRLLAFGDLGEKALLLIAAIFGLLALQTAAPVTRALVGGLASTAARGLTGRETKGGSAVHRNEGPSGRRDQRRDPPKADSLFAGLENRFVTVWLRQGHSVRGRVATESAGAVRLEIGDKHPFAYIIVPIDDIRMIETTGDDERSTPTRRSSKRLVAEVITELEGNPQSLAEEHLFRAIVSTRRRVLQTPKLLDDATFPTQSMSELIDEASSAQDEALYAALRGLEDALVLLKLKTPQPSKPSKAAVNALFDALNEVTQVSGQPSSRSGLMSVSPSRSQ